MSIKIYVTKIYVLKDIKEMIHVHINSNDIYYNIILILLQRIQCHKKSCINKICFILLFKDIENNGKLNPISYRDNFL